MVWFQCESCGENLKKPKLQNHFRGCAARKLSCIDCGVIFDQQSVQAHTSCVSETEKYGPKGVIKGGNASVHKAQKGHKPNTADIDLSIGLTTEPPWACGLCNVSATSFETLEGHSQGKKHRSKAKAALAKLNPAVTAEDQVSADDATPVNEGLPPETCLKLVKGVFESIGRTPPQEGDKKTGKKRKGGAADTSNEVLIMASQILEAVVESPGKKRKKVKAGLGRCKDDSTGEQELNITVDKRSGKAKSEAAVDISAKKTLANEHDGAATNEQKQKKGEKVKSGHNNKDLAHLVDNFDDRNGPKESVISRTQQPLTSEQETAAEEGKETTDNDGNKHSKAVNWKKIFTKVLANSPNGSMKIRSLMKEALVIKASELVPYCPDKKMLKAELSNQLRKSSKFVVEGKVVRLSKPS